MTETLETTTYYTYFFNRNREPIIPDFIDELKNAYPSITPLYDNDILLGWVFEASLNEMNLASEFRNFIPDSSQHDGIGWLTPLRLDIDFTNERKTGWVPEHVKAQILRARELIN